MLQEEVRVIPTFNRAVSQTVCTGLGAAEIREVKARHGKSVLNMCHDGLLYRLSISALILAHQLPNLFIHIIINLILHILWSI